MTAVFNSYRQFTGTVSFQTTFSAPALQHIKIILTGIVTHLTFLPPTNHGSELGIRQTVSLSKNFPVMKFIPLPVS
jgi:hypothetical protein